MLFFSIIKLLIYYYLIVKLNIIPEKQCGKCQMIIYWRTFTVYFPKLCTRILNMNTNDLQIFIQVSEEDIYEDDSTEDKEFILQYSSDSSPSPQTPSFTTVYRGADTEYLLQELTTGNIASSSR